MHSDPPNRRTHTEEQQNEWSLGSTGHASRRRAEQPKDIACPTCARPIGQWTENKGEGYSGNGILYCSQDCAKGAKENAHPA